jgi:hypothetical protein
MPWKKKKKKKKSGKKVVFVKWGFMKRGSLCLTCTYHHGARECYCGIKYLPVNKQKTVLGPC